MWGGEGRWIREEKKLRGSEVRRVEERWNGVELSKVEWCGGT